ncbi:MAG: hypothetical protein ACPGUC_04595 [Gammaproteobacteria bacterium]
MRTRRLQTDPFTDLLFNALLGFTFLFLVTIMLVNPIAKMGRVNLKAEYIISVTWPENLPDDVDIWVEDPNGNVVSYLSKDAGWLHLDRDDRGDINDVILIDGQEVIHPVNQEIVTIRGFVAGEYVINLYFYQQRSQQPFEAVVKVEKVNPTLKLMFIDKVNMVEQDQETTVVRFSLRGDGELYGLNRLAKTLTPFDLDGTEFSPDLYGQ